MVHDKIPQSSSENQTIQSLKDKLKRAEAENTALHKKLEKSAQVAGLYLQTVDNSPNPIFSIDANGIILTWNPACSTIFQYSGSMIGMHFGKLIADKNQLEYLIEKLHKMSPDKSLINVDLSYKCKKGDIREMVSRVYPLQNSHNQIEGFVFANTDVTERNRFIRELEEYRNHLELLVDERTDELQQEIAERKEAQKALKASNDALITILDTIEVEISVTDLQTQEIIFLNKHLRSLLEKENPQNLKNKFQPPHDKKRRYNEVFSINTFEKATRDGVTRNYFCQELNKWYLLHDQPVHWVDGRPVLLQVATDITERKRIDQEQQRVAKLESIGMLAGGIAHDFNNLLTGILGNTSLIKILPHGKDHSKIIDNIEKATFRAKALTNQLLTFSKGGAPVRKPTSLTSLLDEAVDFATRGSSICYTPHFKSNLYHAEVDAGQISQVIHNLVFNAVQAMPAGGNLDIHAENTTIENSNSFNLKKGKYVKLIFQDNGPGIPEANLSQIFDPYFTTKATGSGLGLATSHTIIQKHFGHISARNDGGAVFTILLPAVNAIPTKAPETQNNTFNLSGRILVMDDEQLIREVITAILNRIGCDAITTKDGQSTIDIYRQAIEQERPFDAVILDLTIPGGMGGEETLLHLKEINPDIKAIVSSGYSTNPVMAKHREFGFYDVVTKPYNLNEMFEVLKRTLA